MNNEKELREKLIDFMKKMHPSARMAVIKRAEKYRDIYEYVLEKTKDIPDIPFSTRVYFVISDDYSYRKCALSDCDKDIPHGRRADPFNGYESKYCSLSCAQKSEETRQKIEDASMKKYGTRLPQLSNIVKKKMSVTKLSKTDEENALINAKRRETCLEKYGTESASQNLKVREKMREAMLSKTEEEKKDIQERTVKTNLIKYGVRRPAELKEIQERARQTHLKNFGVDWPMQLKETQNKSKETCLKKYGVDIAAKADIVKEHAKETFRKTFGVDHPMQLKEIQEKRRQTIQDHLGVDFPLQNKEIKEHAMQTNIERYGGASPMCSHEIRSKAKMKYSYDGVYFDSGAELAYYVWLKDNGIDFKYHPEPISYKDSEGVERKYFPDFLVEGKIVEIKGDIWWENATEEKQNAIKGYVDKIMFKNEYLKFLEYVKKKYGRDFIKNCKRKKHV